MANREAVEPEVEREDGVRAAGALVQLILCDGPIGIAFEQEGKGVLLGWSSGRGEALQSDSSAGVLVDADFTRLHIRVEQVDEALVVNLAVADVYLALQVVPPGQLPEDVRDGSRYYASLIERPLTAAHRVRLPRPRLTIGKDARVEPVHCVLHRRPSHSLVHLLLSCPG